MVGGTVDGRDLATDGTKLDGVEAAADVTDEANVTDALDGASLTDLGTPASGDLILLQDASDSSILKTANFSEVGEIYTEQHAASHTISAAEQKGGMHYITAAGTVTLAAIASGDNVDFAVSAAVVGSIDPNASDTILLDGVSLDAGDKITSDGTQGSVVRLTYYGANTWYATTDGTWSDGGP